jgi:hypothetical protein
MKKQSFFLFVLILAITFSCQKHETHKVYRNGAVVEVDGPMPTLAKPGEHKRIPPADGKYPAITFTETEFDFGEMKQHQKVTHEFEFKNTGEAELVISDAIGSCGCTVPEYPKEAIAPGGSGKIKVTFDSGSKRGMQHKTVTLTTNTKAEKEQIQIKANINLDVK